MVIFDIYQDKFSDILVSMEWSRRDLILDFEQSNDVRFSGNYINGYSNGEQLTFSGDFIFHTKEELLTIIDILKVRGCDEFLIEGHIFSRDEICIDKYEICVLA